jgi:hypothetical protein
MKEIKKYKVIAKVSDTKFVKYNVNNLLLFTDFLDKNFNGWRWFNVYSKNENREQIGNFTNKNRPTKRFL